MRYFLINYKASTLEPNPVQIESFIYFVIDKFPSYYGIKRNIQASQVGKRLLDIDNIVITNIFEFKSKEDYENFKS